MHSWAFTKKKIKNIQEHILTIDSYKIQYIIIITHSNSVEVQYTVRGRLHFKMNWKKTHIQNQCVNILIMFYLMFLNLNQSLTRYRYPWVKILWYSYPSYWHEGVKPKYTYYNTRTCPINMHIEMSRWVSTRERTQLTTGSSQVGLRKTPFFQKWVELNSTHLTHRFEPGWGWVDPLNTPKFFYNFFNNYLLFPII